MWPGEQVRLQVEARYELPAGNPEAVSGAVLAAVLGAFGIPTGSLEGGAAYDAFQGLYGAVGLQADDQGGLPHAYLNYVLFDANYAVVGQGHQRLAEVAGGSGRFTPYQTLSLGVTVGQAGYLYSWLSNESGWQVNVVFDDFKIEHVQPARVVQATDYYPFGSVLRSFQEVPRYRFGYQGQYAELDEETGWNSFALRMYDSRIGRWLSTDPYEQYASPYLGMGNNPVMGVDPDGGWNDWYQSESGATLWQAGDAASVTVNGETFHNIGETYTTTEMIGGSFHTLYYIQNDLTVFREGIGNLQMGDRVMSPINGIARLNDLFGQRDLAAWQVNSLGRISGYSPITGVGPDAPGAKAARVASLATNASKLARHLRQIEKYGRAGFKMLQNGRIRYYGSISSARNPGEMIGRRLVREWNPASGATRAWHETVDVSLRVRIIRPETGGTKVHYMFDQFGRYTGSW